MEARLEEFFAVWERWPSLLALLLTLAVVVYAFMNRSKQPMAQTIYQTVAILTLVLSIPAALLNPMLGLQSLNVSPDARLMFVGLSVLSSLIALATSAISFAGVGRMPQTLPANPQPWVATPVPELVLVEHIHEFYEGDDGGPSAGDPSATLGMEPLPRMSAAEPEADSTLLLRPETGSQYFAWVVELTGPRAGTTHAVTHARTTIGRSEEAHIRLADRAVSSVHVALVRDEQQACFVLHDLASSNGTFIGQQRLETPLPLHDKERFRIGETLLHFMEARLAEEPPLSTNTEIKSEEQEVPLPTSEDVSAPHPSSPLSQG